VIRLGLVSFFTGGGRDEENFSAEFEEKEKKSRLSRTYVHSCGTFGDKKKKSKGQKKIVCLK